jgi:hypothetical protein
VRTDVVVLPHCESSPVLSGDAVEFLVGPRLRVEGGQASVQAGGVSSVRLEFLAGPLQGCVTARGESQTGGSCPPRAVCESSPRSDFCERWGLCSGYAYPLQQIHSFPCYQIQSLRQCPDTVIQRDIAIDPAKRIDRGTFIHAARRPIRETRRESRSERLP